MPSSRLPPAPHAPRLSSSDYELLAQFRRALREFISFSESAAAEMGLAPQQHQALLAIKGTPGRDGLYIGEIAERLMIKPHTAAELVTRLVRMDLARRLPDPADGRRVQVVLTAHAESLLEDLSVAHLEELRGIRPLLARLLDRFDDAPGKADPADEG